jgi:hypothetical protein
VADRIAPEYVDPSEVDCEHDGADCVELEFDMLKFQTPEAVLLIIGGDEVWVPKSQIAEIGAGYAFVSRWFAEKARWFAEKEGLV